MTFAELLKKHKISTADFCRRFEIPYMTAAKWRMEDRTPPPYILKMADEILKNEKERLK